MKLVTATLVTLAAATGIALAQTAPPSAPPTAPPAAAPSAAPAPAKADPANDAKFRALDKDGNGMLEGAEADTLKADMAKIDANKDGKVQRAEFDAAVKSSVIK
jgi:EF hand